MENNTILFTGSLNVLLWNGFEQERQLEIDFKPSLVICSLQVRHSAFILSCVRSFTYCGDLYKGKKSLRPTTGGQRKEQKKGYM